MPRASPRSFVGCVIPPRVANLILYDELWPWGHSGPVVAQIEFERDEFDRAIGRKLTDD